MLTKRYFKSKDEYEVTFELASDAGQVALVCEANGWEPVTMKKSKGVFKTKMRLPANGRYQYRFLVDNDKWVNDSAADAFVANEFGTHNSVVDTYSAN